MSAQNQADAAMVPSDHARSGEGHNTVVGAVAALLALACFVRFGLSARALVGAFFVVVLVVLSAIDLRERRLPNRIVVPATFVILIAQIAFFPDRSGEWLLAAFGAGFAFLLLFVTNPRGLGMGDVKLAALLGAALGRNVFVGIFIGVFAAALVGVFILSQHGLEARKRSIPFGPFLALGAIIAFFAQGTGLGNFFGHL
jgi:leader peptidase (prepilin peptidase)/N-methyltransferase